MKFTVSKEERGARVLTCDCALKNGPAAEGFANEFTVAIISGAFDVSPVILLTCSQCGAGMTAGAVQLLAKEP